jgi:DNA-binding MarR family transcriptional regulator
MTPKVFTPTPAEEEWFSILALREVVVQAMEADLEARHELSLASLVILLALVKHGNDLSIGELTPLVAVVSRSQVSRLVDSLHERGLVERTPDPIDARIRRVSITSAGTKTLTAARRTASSASTKALAALTPTDHQHLTTIWQKLSQ